MHLIFLSVPALRSADLSLMPRLSALMMHGGRAQLHNSFPAVTWPSQATMLTGCAPQDHGVTANGFFWRDTNEVEMWTAGNEKIQAPQIWDKLKKHRPELTSAVWFPMLSKRCSADYVCMPAPIHNPDGSESLWCYTQPTQLYGELRDRLGHFPLQHFWGPLAGIQSTKWIVDSAVVAAEKYAPNFFYIYLPHLDYAAQRTGPDSPLAQAAVVELDEQIGRLVEGVQSTIGQDCVWVAASEYVITDVDHVTYPNRLLAQSSLLVTTAGEGGTIIDFEKSAAWCLVDHQFSHVYVKNAEPNVVRRVQEVFAAQPGIAEMLAGPERGKYGMIHERSGELILISEPNSWQAYYWWQDDQSAPAFARQVDIHRKPGYDPVELFWDRETNSVPLNAELSKGSHGAPSAHPSGAVLLTSAAAVLKSAVYSDRDVATLLMGQFGYGR